MLSAPDGRSRLDSRDPADLDRRSAAATGRAAEPTVDDRVELTDAAIDVTSLLEWASVPAAGAVVTFSGIVREHAEGRDGVTALTYEAYEAPARARLAEVVGAARDRWPGIERVAVVHRLGRLDLGETSVLVVVSAPHRGEAFEAARFCIDTLKETVPIWKQEHWRDGVDWGTGSTPIRAVGAATTSEEGA